MDIQFILNSILLGAGLAMDAFSVSLANGLGDVNMKRRRECLIAGTFALFQFAMPLIGWFCVSSAVRKFEQFAAFVPYIALILLGIIGGNMIFDGIKHKSDANEAMSLTFITLIVQGIATSIDALSVGFTIAEYSALEAVFACAIIAVVTFLICIMGIKLGKKAGTKIAGRASILGGAILVFIGLEIFITSLF